MSTDHRNVVYWATNIKPAPVVIVEIGYRMLAEVVGTDVIIAQAYADAPREDDVGHSAGCYSLTDEGIYMYRHGIIGPPEGFREWPKDVPLPDFTMFPINSGTELTVA